MARAAYWHRGTGRSPRAGCHRAGRSVQVRPRRNHSGSPSRHGVLTVASGVTKVPTVRWQCKGGPTPTEPIRRSPRPCTLILYTQGGAIIPTGTEGFFVGAVQTHTCACHDNFCLAGSNLGSHGFRSSCFCSRPAKFKTSCSIESIVSFIICCHRQSIFCSVRR